MLTKKHIENFEQGDSPMCFHTFLRAQFAAARKFRVLLNRFPANQ